MSEISRFNLLGHKRPDGELVFYVDYEKLWAEINRLVYELDKSRSSHMTEFDKLDDANIKYYEENKKLKEANKVLKDAVEFYKNPESKTFCETDYEMKAREALAGADKIMGMRNEKF